MTGLPGPHVPVCPFGTGSQGPVIVAPPEAPGAGEQLQTKTPHVPTCQLAPGPGSRQEPGQLALLPPSCYIYLLHLMPLLFFPTGLPHNLATK